GAWVGVVDSMSSILPRPVRPIYAGSLPARPGGVVPLRIDGGGRSQPEHGAGGPRVAAGRCRARDRPAAGGTAHRSRRAAVSAGGGPGPGSAGGGTAPSSATTRMLSPKG